MQQIAVTALTVAPIANNSLKTQKIKTVLAVGGSVTSFYLARHLEKAGLKVCIVESDPERAADLEATLENVSVLCADGTDTAFLDEYKLENVIEFIKKCESLNREAFLNIPIFATKTWLLTNWGNTINKLFT